jgi:zinc protease
LNWDTASTPSTGQERTNLAGPELTRTTLDNGLQVLLKPSTAAPVASFWVFFRVGSRNEAPGLTGVSHWVEHMLFKGTERYPRGEFDRLVARAGGLFNGMTGADWTTYFETFPADRIELALQVESDRMANTVFDPAEVEAERTVILSEREGSENSYFQRLVEEVQATAYVAHPYRHPVIGWKTDLQSLTRDDLWGHYRTYYTPNNAVVAATGDFDRAAMLDRIAHHFGAIAPGAPPPPVRVTEPDQTAERRVVLRGEDPTSYLLQAFHVPAATHDDFFPLVVLDSILGGAKGMGLFGGSANNRSNRLYRALVESQLAIDVDSSMGPTLDAGLFTIGVTVAPDVDLRTVEEVIWTELTRLQDGGITAAEMAKAVKQTRAQFAYGSESVTNQGYWLGFSEIVASQEWFDSWLERLAAVAADDVQRVAQAYFAREKQTVGWYVPNADAVSADLEEPE